MYFLYDTGPVHLILNKIQRAKSVQDSSKLKELADRNFIFDEICGKFYERVENTVGERRNCLLQAISPFPQYFRKTLDCRHVKTGLFGKGSKSICGTVSSYDLVISIACNVLQF